MKKILIFLAWIVPFLTSAQKKHEVIFTAAESWGQILKKAKVDQQFIFVNAISGRSVPASKMQEDVFVNEEVAELLKNFISIKIQVDSTASDNQSIKSWYKDAHAISKKAGIAAFPAFLFYNPDGELIFKTYGFKDAYKFGNLLKFVHERQYTDVRKAYFNYQNGTRNYSQMPKIITAANTLVGDAEFAAAVVKDYKENYLDHLTIVECLSREYLQFMYENNGMALLKPCDNFFLAAYQFPEKVDSLIKQPVSALWTMHVISTYQVIPLLYTNGKPKNENPDWEAIKKIVQTKYPLLRNLNDFIAKEKIIFYRDIEDWQTYIELKSKQIENELTKPNAIDAFYGLNGPAWDIFLHSNDKIALEKALEWSEISIKISKPGDAIQFLDTKANLLYKLGRKEEAISTENKAIEFVTKYAHKSPHVMQYYIKVYTELIEKMKNGDRTWK